MDLDVLNKARERRGKPPLGWSSVLLGIREKFTNADLPGINVDVLPLLRPSRDKKWEKRKRDMKKWK